MKFVRKLSFARCILFASRSCTIHTKERSWLKDRPPLISFPPAPISFVLAPEEKSFRSFIQYYREFMPRYSEVALPLISLTRDDAPADHSHGLSTPVKPTFERIRDYRSDPSNLAAFKNNLPVDLFTDASTQAWGGFLEQQRRPLAFLSGTFGKT